MRADSVLQGVCLSSVDGWLTGWGTLHVNSGKAVRTSQLEYRPRATPLR